MSADLCEQIADMQRKLQRCRTTHVMFLDETAPTHTIVLHGEQAYVMATETSSYSKRYVGDRVLLPKIFHSD